MPQTTLGMRFSVALHHTARIWKTGLDRRLKFLGLSQAAWMAIAMIAKAEQPLSQTELANAVGVETPTMVPMLDRLVRDGLVERLPSPTDRRIKLVALTANGRTVYDKLHAEANAYRQEVLARLDPKALKQATELLEQLRDTLENLA
jgi:MarR family transcriptional regulator for hemolysin